jgi:hypothetical protein
MAWTMPSYPFPTRVVDGLWDDEILLGAVDEFPPADDPRWRRFNNEHERKLGGTDEMIGPYGWAIIERLLTLGPWIEREFNLSDLVMRLVGGGFHMIEPGGFLDVHTDFNRLGELYRRVNLIVYLNDGWTPADGGELELWGDDSCVLVPPRLGTTVAFVTSDRSFHGHPTPLPGPKPRRSIAAYLYSEQPPPGYVVEHSTVWR